MCSAIGVVGPDLAKVRLCRKVTNLYLSLMVWKDQPKRVIVPLTKRYKLSGSGT